MSKIVTRTSCRCDVCGDPLEMYDCTKTVFIRRAREAYGWSIGKYTKCGECK